MLGKESVEVLVVTTVDATHDRYIIPALQRGIRVLTEKPMTTDIEKSKAILRAVKETGNRLTVTFVSTRSRLRFTGLVFCFLSFGSVAREREREKERLIIDTLFLALQTSLSPNKKIALDLSRT
jgi:hypothetical protein